MTIVTAVRNSGVMPPHLTDREVISLFKTHFARPGPMLSAFIQRYEQAVDRLEGNVSFPNYKPERVSCPHCGSALLLHSTAQQLPEPPNAA
jgi:hypothetical protein